MKRALGIAMVLFLVGAVTLIEGCSNGKDPQEKEEPAVEKVTSVSNEKDITKEPTKKESSGKEEVTDLGKDVKLEMILIPAGKFVMGSPESEKGRSKGETQHEVTLTKPFYMGKYEVTQEQWKAVMGTVFLWFGGNPSSNKGAKYPVTNVSWNDCQDFIKKLNTKMNGSYRLPTEAEWEYACRAGTMAAYSFGDSITKSDTNIAGSSTKAVGSYKPNAFGLYDMHGNVWEWCEDWGAGYPAGAVTDPKGAATGERRVLRGGSFYLFESSARSSFRSYLTPSDQLNGLGFRLAKTK
jgi:formylglycine-generating enzyme required for sulfatase activity